MVRQEVIWVRGYLGQGAECACLCILGVYVLPARPISTSILATYQTVLLTAVVKQPRTNHDQLSPRVEGNAVIDQSNDISVHA